MASLSKVGRKRSNETERRKAKESETDTGMWLRIDKGGNRDREKY
jgi:hypothetical protein